MPAVVQAAVDVGTVGYGSTVAVAFVQLCLELNAKFATNVVLNAHFLRLNARYAVRRVAERV